MKAILILSVLALANAAPGAHAEIRDLPALYDVSGLSAEEALNVRAAPGLGAEIIGTLPPDTRLKEVVALTDDGGWGRVNLGERAGWVSMKFMRDAGGPRWWARDLPLSCFGTEPFWSAVIFRGDSGNLELQDHTGVSPDSRTMALGRFQRVWGNPQWDQPMNAILNFADNSAEALAVVRAESCNDGMSDREFGLSVSLFLESSSGEVSPYLGGCCSIGN